MTMLWPEDMIEFQVALAVRGFRPCAGPHQMTEPYLFAGEVRRHCERCGAWEPCSIRRRPQPLGKSQSPGVG